MMNITLIRDDSEVKAQGAICGKCLMTYKIGIADMRVEHWRVLNLLLTMILPHPFYSQELMMIEFIKGQTLNWICRKKS